MHILINPPLLLTLAQLIKQEVNKDAAVGSIIYMNKIFVINNIQIRVMILINFKDYSSLYVVIIG